MSSRASLLCQKSHVSFNHLQVFPNLYNFFLFSWTQNIFEECWLVGWLVGGWGLGVGGGEITTATGNFFCVQQKEKKKLIQVWNNMMASKWWWSLKYPCTIPLSKYYYTFTFVNRLPLSTTNNSIKCCQIHLHLLWIQPKFWDIFLHFNKMKTKRLSNHETIFYSQ